MALPRLTSFLQKFFLAGKGLSFTTGKYFGQAVLVGVFSGFVVVGFRYLIDLGGSVIGSVPVRPLQLVLPAVGALLGYLLCKFGILLEYYILTAEADAPCFRIDFKNLAAYYVADFELVFDLLCAARGNLGNMDKPVD